MELVVRVLGICVAFLPFIYFATYIIKKATAEQKFDLHLARVKDKKGNIGVLIAYVSRIFLFILITSIGVYISSFFTNSVFLDIVIVSLLGYIFSSFFDNKNDIS